jgi:hypothetical protein
MCLSTQFLAPRYISPQFSLGEKWSRRTPKTCLLMRLMRKYLTSHLHLNVLRRLPVPPVRGVALSKPPLLFSTSFKVRKEAQWVRASPGLPSTFPV